MNNFYLFLLILLALMTTRLNAQDKKKEDALYVEIARMDSIVFNAFNQRDTATFKKLFTGDLEFYHDKGGLTGYQQTVEFMRSITKDNNGLRRDLVPGTLEVYSIPGYGAMQIGSHTFCHPENGKQECGTFKFMHVWKQTGNGWKISRVISYDH